MKNQYFGDINDYRKYGLLRLLSGRGKLKTAVCWMLTPDDQSSDGRHIKYLRYPLLWSQYDSELYNWLQETVIKKHCRTVSAFEKNGLLPSAYFYRDILPDDARGRPGYFKSFMDIAQSSDLIFFDPDNGIEVKSVPYGRKGSSKYLYWREIVAAYITGHSVLAYQHFPRVKGIKRDMFINALARRLFKETGARTVYTFRTTYVVFLLACWEQHRAFFDAVIPEVDSNWDIQFRISIHNFKK